MTQHNQSNSTEMRNLYPLPTACTIFSCWSRSLDCPAITATIMHNVGWRACQATKAKQKQLSRDDNTLSMTRACRLLAANPCWPS